VSRAACAGEPERAPPALDFDCFWISPAEFLFIAVEKIQVCRVGCPQGQKRRGGQWLICWLSVRIGLMNTPETTLFMLMSLDGKISTGASDERDMDKDLPSIAGTREGLQQYYTLEEETDLFSFNTGRVMAKVGWNEEKTEITKLPVSFVIIDNKPHLTSLGVSNLIKRTKKPLIVTTNTAHPALQIDDSGLEVISYEQAIDFVNLFERLKQQGVDRLTVQSGGEMNSNLLRLGLINNLSIVIAPVLVGGRDTPTLIDGDSLTTIEDLQKLRTLELKDVRQLENSYIHITYKVINQ
jgi:2,5-diamino-6-(ribosylamino)-4(3H)-pyrimidinone 5'-phosphate reductase